MIIRENAPRLVFALLLGILAFFAALPAFAQAPDVTWVPPFAPPSPADFIAGSALNGLFTFILVRVARQFLREWLAPTPATPASKRLTLLVALVAGTLLGLAHIGVQVTPGLHGWALGGFFGGALAFVGAGALGTKGRREKQALPEVSDPFGTADKVKPVLPPPEGP